MPLKIGIISTMSPFPWGGSEELWAATAFEALKAGHEVNISVFGWPSPAPKLLDLRRSGARIFLRHHPEFQAARSTLGPTSSFYDFFKSDPDVIAISQGNPYEFLSYLDLMELLYTGQVPYVLICQYNDTLSWWLAKEHSRQQACSIFSRASRVLFVSDRNRIEAERQLAAKIPNAGVVLNPVNLSDRSSISWPESTPARFASVARLEAKFKGQDVLIEALSGDLWKERDWHLTLYGSGPDELYLRSLVIFFELEDRITFAGHEKDVRKIWAYEQILVMFSRAEGTPLALVEAMLCGRPAIVSDVGGNQEWVAEGQTGFVAEAPVIGLARAALERSWSSRERWHELGMHAHNSATVKLSDPNFPGLLNTLHEAAKQKGVTPPAAVEELEQLKRYRTQTGSTLEVKAKRVLRAGTRHLQQIADRWRSKFSKDIKRFSGRSDRS